MQNKSADDWLPTRHTLIARLKNLDDDSSWQEFFDIYGKFIFSIAIRSGLSRGEGEEVVQETVLSVSKKIQTFKADPSAGSFKAWLAQLVRWRIGDLIRKRQRDEARRQTPCPTGKDPASTTSTAPEARIADPTGNGFDAMWDEEWAKSLLEAGVERLKAKVREDHYQIFQMHFLKDQPAAKVAEFFGTTPDDVYLIKHRLNKVLREEILALEKNFG